MKNSTKKPSSNTPSLKIGLVLDDSLDKTGGIQEYMLALGGWLQAQGHEVRYLVGETKRQDISGVHSLSRNVGVRFNGNRMSMPLPTNRRMLKSFLEREKFDVLHVQLPHSPWMSHRLVLAAPLTTAVFGTFHIAPHSGPVTVATKALGGWTRRSVRRFDEIVSVSTAAQSFARQTFGVHSRVVPNMFDYERFASAKPRSEYATKGLKVLFLGRLVPRKGCQFLLQAIHELAQSGRVPEGLQVLVCGKGPLQASLERYTRENGLQDIVQFVGYITEEDKPSYYASADIAVFPSTGGESFGIVLIEAMANGRTTVLGGDNPGYHTILESQPKLLCKPADAKDLAEKLGYFLENPQARTAMADWGREHAKQFDMDIVGRAIMDGYRKALAKRRA